LGGFQGDDRGCEHVLDHGLLLVADRSLEAAHLEFEQVLVRVLEVG
jgi:hypothetical protein